MGGPTENAITTGTEKSLSELFFEIEHSCDGKIGEGEEYRRATMLLDSVNDLSLFQEDYPQSVSLYTKLKRQYMELEEVIGELHQKNKSWWSHPFTSVEEFQKIAEDLTLMIWNSEQALCTVFSKEARKRSKKELSNKNYQKALLHFTISLTLVTDDYRLFGDRAYCYCKLDYTKEAIQDLEKALEIQPLWEEGYLRLGRAYFSTSQYEKSVELYTRGIQRLPKSSKLEEALAESQNADNLERRLRNDISFLGKRLAELGVDPKELTVEKILSHFSERLRTSYETPASGCNQSKVVARVRAIITVILHRCRFEGQGVVDALVLAREWYNYKEKVISFSLEALMRVSAMVLNDIEALLSESKLPLRISRFPYLRSAIWKTFYKCHMIPRFKEARNLLQEKVNMLLNMTEAQRDFQDIESRVFNLVEMNALENIIIPAISFLSKQEQPKFLELLSKKTRRTQRKRFLEEELRTAITRDDIMSELRDLCSELTEFKYQQGLKNKELQEKRERLTPLQDQDYQIQM